jgi:PAS domain S-box-containing protein
MASETASQGFRKPNTGNGDLPADATDSEVSRQLGGVLSYPIVAIGTSDGDLAAVTELLKALPSNPGMAFVFIQHLEPGHESALTALLAKATTMPVIEASDGMAVVANRVYVIPPNKGMTIRKGVLRLRARSADSGQRRPIDDFFAALAEERGHAAIGVVFSGKGVDGAEGLKSIKVAGGVTFAQEPKTVQWPTMLIHAVSADSVDFILSPDRMAKELVRVGRYPNLEEAPEADLIHGAREEAQWSGDLSRAIVETIHDGLLVVDSELRAIRANQSLCNMFRISFRELEGKCFLGQGEGQYDIPKLRDLLQDVLLKDTIVENFEIEQDFIRTGHRFLVLNARRIDASNTILIAVRDITERKRAREINERKLAQEQELRILRAFVEQAPISIMMLDRKMRYIQASQHHLDNFGMTREQVIGRSHYEVIPNLPEHLKEAHRRCLAGELLIGNEERLTTPKGKELWFNWRMTPWGDCGECTGGILISTEDITDKRRAEIEAQRNAATITSLLESAPQSVIAVNRDQIIVLVNGNTEDMFGYKREELLGRRIDILIPEIVRARHTQHYYKYFTNTPDRPMEMGIDLTGRRKDGTIFPVEIRLSSIDAATGKLAVAFVSNISQRKQMEQAAQAHANQVQTLAASLLTAKDDEDCKVSRELHDQVCQQLASLAFDISELLSHPLSEDLQHQLKALQVRVVKISEETRHIAHELHSSVIDDLGLMASLRDLCQQYSERNPETALEFIGGSLQIAVPREVASCLYRVAQEGLQNITRHAGAKHISVAVAGKKGTVTLTIADDGVGFDLKAAAGHGGLGLIGMEERVRLVKGKLSILTQPLHGTRIVLEVPLHGGCL